MSTLIWLSIAAVAGIASLRADPVSSKADHEDVQAQLRHYAIEFLRRYPNVNTYLGGGGLDPILQDVDGELRDHSSTAIEEEDRWLTSELRSFEQLNSSALTQDLRIDREVVLAQIRFMLHLHQVRKYQQRAIDTYSDEPLKAVELSLQGMSATPESAYGTPEEWTLLVRRVRAIPRFLATAQTQLAAGVQAGNTPDWRVLRRNGLQVTETNAGYFEKTLPALAEERMSPAARELLAPLKQAAKDAAVAYRGFHQFIADTFFEDVTRKGADALKPSFRADRYELGEREYDWALRNNLHVKENSASLFERAWPTVQRSRDDLIKLAHEIVKRHGWWLPYEGAAAVRVVLDELSKDHPASDEEMLEWFRRTGARLVDYGRKTEMFDVPVDYKLEVMETPLPLRASLSNASYNAAPPFKNKSVGRFYLSPTGNDLAALRANNRSSIATLTAHEGFPGHDWHFKIMTLYHDEISPVRWLSPGAIDDSSAMWEDAMAAEGWALYAEALMAEPQKNAPEGFYTPEERLYQLRAKLQRDLRVYLDIGLHTGRLTVDRAVDVYSETLDFLPGSCSNNAAVSSDKKPSCEAAEKQIFRYLKWPTQAVTYRLGKDEITALRAKESRALGNGFSSKAFHLSLMKQGTIPATYFRDSRAPGKETPRPSVICSSRRRQLRTQRTLPHRACECSR
jgi:uncharacterized protein (DUF885 family)